MRKAWLDKSNMERDYYSVFETQRFHSVQVPDEKAGEQLLFFADLARNFASWVSVARQQVQLGNPLPDLPEFVIKIHELYFGGDSGKQAKAAKAGSKKGGKAVEVGGGDSGEPEGTEGKA